MTSLGNRSTRKHQSPRASWTVPAPPAGGDHPGCPRLGRVEPRLRHDLCRGAGGAYVESLSGLRAPVPRADASRRQPDHGVSPSHLDRAEDNLQEPTLDRGDGDRDLRLYAPAVGAVTLTAACRSRRRRSRRWSRAPADAEGTRLFLLRRWCLWQDSSDLVRVSSGSRSMASSTISTTCRARQEAQARDRGRGRPRRGSSPDLAQRLARNRSETALGLADGLCVAEKRGRRRAAHHVGQVRLPGLPACDRAAAVLVPTTPMAFGACGSAWARSLMVRS